MDRAEPVLTMPMASTDPPVEPHGHGVHGEHAHRPLGEHAQEQERDEDCEQPAHLGDAHAGEAEERDDSGQDAARPVAIHERADIDHRQRREHRTGQGLHARPCHRRLRGL